MSFTARLQGLLVGAAVVGAFYIKTKQEIQARFGETGNAVEALHFRINPGAFPIKAQWEEKSWLGRYVNVEGGERTLKQAWNNQVRRLFEVVYRSTQ